MEILLLLTKQLGSAVEIAPATHRDFVDGVASQIVAAPRDEEVARELIALCGREKWAFVVAGGNTQIGIGAPPSRLDLRISTKHLNQIWDFDEGNATVEAGAGISLESLNESVGEREQFVPLDAAFQSTGATLGGAVACNTSGESRLKWNTPRDLVTGLRAVLSDNREVRGGAKVVKNVSGYDLPKVFTGSFGTLGLITRATIRLRPRDAVSSTWTHAFDSLRDVQRIAEQITGGPFEPTFLRASWRGEWSLRARFDGGQRAVGIQIERLPASQEVSSIGVSSTKSAWRLRAILPLTRAISWLRAAHEMGANGLDWDCALGVVEANFANLTLAQLADLRADAEKLGGFLRVDEAPSEFKTPDLVWGAPRSDFVLMQRVKAVYDAANVCAPGRNVGGL